MSMLIKNLNYLIYKLNTNAKNLAAMAGVGQPTLSRILSGETKDPRHSNIQRLADYFNISADALRTIDLEKSMEGGNDGAKEALDELIEAPKLRPFKNVPVVGAVEGGLDGYLEHTDLQDGTIEYPAKYPDTYALRVRGDSMRPRIKSGEFIVVEPHVKALPGDDVVVVCKDGRKMVKELLYSRDNEITLGSINNCYKPVSLPKDQIDTIHYVAAIIPRGAFHKP